MVVCASLKITTPALPKSLMLEMLVAVPALVVIADQVNASPLMHERYCALVSVKCFGLPRIYESTLAELSVGKIPPMLPSGGAAIVNVGAAV